MTVSDGVSPSPKRGGALPARPPLNPQPDWFTLFIWLLAYYCCAGQHLPNCEEQKLCNSDKNFTW